MLEKIKVLDFSRYIAGPYCASILGDLGAEVIRIEQPGGGEDRLLIPVTEEGDGALFLQMNRNKKSLAIDIGSPPGREAIKRLVRTADVIVTNVPILALARMGLDYAALRNLKADIIATNLSAFGPVGPLSGHTGFDAVAQAASGSAYLAGDERGPARAGSSYVDYGTGLAGALGTLAALIHRSQTGEGQEVQASLMATALAFVNAAHIEAAALGVNREPYGNRSPFSGPSDFFPTTNGTIAVQVVGNQMFGRWAALVGRPELGNDERFCTDSVRGLYGKELSAVMNAWTAVRSTEAALAELKASGIPAGPIRSPFEVVQDETIAAGGFFADGAVAGSLPVSNLLVRMGSMPQTVRQPAPAPGEHNAEILASIGYRDEEIAALSAVGNGRPSGRPPVESET